MELEDLPIIDRELAIKLAGNQRELAHDIHSILLRDLKTDLIEIKQLYQSQNYPELLRHVHKLHGALCYCGLPRLKNVAANFELALKSKVNANLASLLNQLEVEATLFIEYYPTHPL